MQPFFQWVRHNATLSFFFGIEIICLIYGFIWVLGPYGEAPNSHVRVASAPMIVVAEATNEDFVTLAMDEFALSQEADYQIVLSSRAQAIQEFAKNENAILILSKQLHNDELAALNIKSDRLPLQQEVIDNSMGSDANSPVFVRDSKTSKEENNLATFLSDNRAQDVVLQKLYQRPFKGSSRNG